MASIDVFCKINAGGELSSSSSKFIINGNKIINDDGASDFKFKEIFKVDVTNTELYSSILDELTQYFLCHYNTCLLLLGSRENISSYFVRGKQYPDNEPPLIDHIVEQLYNEFNKRKDRQRASGAASTSSQTSEIASKDEIHMNIYEVIDGQIKDLIVMAHSATSQISVIDSPEVVDDNFDGVHVKNLKSHQFCLLTMNKIQNKIYKAMKESKLLKANSQLIHPIVLEFSLQKHVEGFDIPVKCWYRIVVLTYFPFNNTGSKNGSEISRNRIVFDCLLNDVSSENVSQSPSDIKSTVLKTLMSDPIGGNCITKSLITIDSCITETNTFLLQYVLTLSSVFNYPVDNLPHVKGLLAKFRSQVKHLEKRISRDKNVTDAFIDQLKEQIQLLDADNNEIFKNKLEVESLYNDVKEKYNKIVATHSELSSKSVLSTAEKLKLSKEAVELKMKANKLQQEAEKQVFDLKNKLLLEQEEKSKIERSLAYERKLHEDLKEKYGLLKKDNEDVCEEYINLKSNYQSITTQYQEQVQINNDLNEMVKKLSFRKEQLSSEKSELEIKQIKEFNDHIQKLSLALSSGKKSPSIPPSNPVKLGSRSAESKDIAKLRESHFNELQLLEEKLFSLKKTLNENEEVISSYKQRLVQVTSKMLVIQDNKESTNNRLLEMESMLRNISNEYRGRLEQYVQDVKEFVYNNNQSEMDGKSISDNCIEQIEIMVKGLEESYKNEENIYEKKIKHLTTNYNHILNQHERVLIAYRLALDKSDMSSEKIDDEVSSYEILLPDTNEIQSYQSKERNEMRTKLCIAEQRVKDLEELVQSLRNKVKIQEESLLFKGNISSNEMETFPWSGIQKKIQDFSSHVQRNLEKEKAELLSRCHLAEQQLDDSQNDMKEGFLRYQQEIDRLRHILSGYEQQLVHTSNQTGQGQTGFLPPIEQNRSGYRPDYRR